MRTVLFFTFFSCYLFWGCGPKNEEISEVQTDLEPMKEVADTISNARKDALQTDENNISPTLPLPQDVMQLLTNKYPSWEELNFTENVLQQAKDNTQGPGLIRGDFDGNGRQDYAVQLQHQKQLVVVAILHNADGSWQLQEIKKDILFNDRGHLKSPYMLRLTQAETTLQHRTIRNQITAPHDAVTLSLNGNDIVYLYENGKFVAYNPAD